MDKPKEDLKYRPRELSKEELLEENALLYKEVLVARKASEITSQHVVEQFTKLNELLESLEEKVIIETELREKLAEKLTEADIRKKELAEARAAAENANKAKSEFLANMSHEIRTPMNAIINMSELAFELDLSPKQHEYINIIQSSARSLLVIINDILDFSKIEAGKLKIEAEPFQLQNLLFDIANFFRGDTRHKEIDFVLDVSPDLPPCLIGDAMRLRQVLINLINNAFKFTDQGQISLQIKAISSSNQNIRLEFHFSDTGIGIPLEKVTELFEAFSQVDGSVSRKYGGSGLGLAISQNLVKLMGGDTISVESKPGEGSTFSFSLPFEIGAIPEKPERQPTAVNPAYKVLIVEDNRASQIILNHMLAEFNIQSEIVESGEEAIEKLARGSRYGLVLIDWKLPGIDGLAAAEKILQNGQLTSPPIVLMSAFGSDFEREKAQQKGLTGYLTKPITASELQAVIVDSIGSEYSTGPDQELRNPKLRFRGHRILVVEDKPSSQYAASEILSRVGFEIDIAETGMQALKAVEQNRYSAVLMDIQMPEMDGYETTSQIRNLLKGIPLPIIAMTANAMEGDRERCLEAGMNDYVSKPIDRAKLYQILASWITTRPAQAQ